MTRREFVERFAIEYIARWGNHEGYYDKAITYALELFEQIEGRVPRDKDPTLGGLLR